MKEFTEYIIKFRYGIEVECNQKLVRCKDCKHGYTLTDSAFVTCGRKFHDGQKHEANWFCADGEYKDG